MRTLSLKQTLVAGAAALTIVGAALGVAWAQQAPAASPTPTAPGNRAPTGQVAPGQDRHEQFLNAVAAKLGVSADRLKQAMTEARTELGLPDRPVGGPKGGGFRGGLEVAARAIGISTDQLRQELQGRTLAQVAQAHNVSPTTVANALKADANTRIDQAAAAGRIPADQVAQAKQRAAERIDQMMNQQAPTGRPSTGGQGR